MQDVGFINMLQQLYDTFIRALIRFWNNRFNKSDEINFLRLELEKERRERNKLTEYILELNQLKINNSEPIDKEDFKPLNKHIPFRIKRAQKEAEDREMARKMRLEREQSLDPMVVKTVEQLEKELLGVENAQ